MRATFDLKPFKNTLPYASEIFGIYLPLLGWKSQRTISRIASGFSDDQRHALEALTQNFAGRYRALFTQEGCGVEVAIGIGELATRRNPLGSSVLLSTLRRSLPPITEYRPEIWDDLLTVDRLGNVLTESVGPAYVSLYQERCRELHSMGLRDTHSRRLELESHTRGQLNYESALAGALTMLHEKRRHEVLRDLFYGAERLDALKWLDKLFNAEDPFDVIDPKKQLDRVSLSPIGIVHLFRQYFFEFDTFLGSPVGHVWLSPGSTVELLEISTRKTIVERILETAFESIAKTEKSETQQDELSDAVKESNRDDMALGVNVSANQQWSVGGLGGGSAAASSSFDIGNTQETAREHTHKRMRQQSEKLSTEIRKSFKSTFKTLTETTDTSSKRYVLTNATKDLINYELRRKMRQVGVQVQDIGTYLCWQTYVDDPGAQLGVAKLVHLAKPPETANIPHPEVIVPLKAAVQEVVLTIPFVGQDTSDNDQAYTNGSETEVAAVLDETEHIESSFPQEVMFDQASYTLAHVELDAAGADAKLSLKDNKIENVPGTTKARFTVHLDYVHFHERDSIPIKAKLTWEPVQDLAKIKAENEARLKEYTAKLAEEARKAFIETARERVNKASHVQSRPFEELREEERIVVYRVMIQSMLMKGINQPDNATRHVVAELINSIFDVSKMLYFVAPEWWRPRLHVSRQSLGGTIADDSAVGWGGVAESGRDNYYITEDSTVAKLGSSLGWLLQLDGDNLRNAFLNAPWVKAVIPIRPGKERAAVNWLKQVEGMNGIGPADMYTGNEPELQGKTLLQALEILADQVAGKHEEAVTTSEFPDPDDAMDDDRKVTATPIDKVYEHGFYPLQGGFRAQTTDPFEVFDQWIEVLPTDQVVAVEVKYDPKSGRQL